MTNLEILSVLKTDLQISSTGYDEFLLSLIETAAAARSREGITLTDRIEDGILTEMYAAYMYRQRRNEKAEMPRMLRWQLNNRIMSEKAGNNGC